MFASLSSVARKALALLLAAGLMIASALAGPMEDAISAYQRGDYAESVRLLRPLAEAGRADAQFDLGFMSANGQGVPQSAAEAMKWYRLAAEQGWVYAQVNLGDMYARGDGVAKDTTEAAKWYRLAAEQGYPVAQNYLGYMYGRGDGVAKDTTEAAKWFELAAEQGYAEAQLNLGILYATGDGVAQDYVKAFMWFELAAAQGVEGASTDRALAAKSMTPAQIAEAQRLAAAWVPHGGGVAKAAAAPPKCKELTLGPGNESIELASPIFQISNSGPASVELRTKDDPSFRYKVVPGKDREMFMGNSEFTYTVELVAPATTATFEICGDE